MEVSLNQAQMNPMSTVLTYRKDMWDLPWNVHFPQLCLFSTTTALCTVMGGVMCAGQITLTVVNREKRYYWKALIILKVIIYVKHHQDNWSMSWQQLVDYKNDEITLAISNMFYFSVLTCKYRNIDTGETNIIDSNTYTKKFVTNIHCVSLCI